MRRYSGLSTKMTKPGVKPARNLFGGFRLGRVPVPDFIGMAGTLYDRLRFGIGNYRVVIAGVAAGVLIAFIVILVMDFMKVRSLATYQPNTTTKIYDKNGQLVSELFRQKREVVKLDKIPKHLVNAFIAIEDNEFYDHFGINIKGIVRAFFINIFSGRIKQGGSTITQQLAKVMLTSGERNLYRKAKEACIAIMMEMAYSKDEILELYLNQIFMGHGSYGVESASRFYFDKHVWELSLAESSLLAALPSAPNKLSPIRYPKTAIERHKVVLAKMIELGFVRIKEAEDAFLAFWPNYLADLSDMSPSMNTWSTRLNRTPWFTEYIRRELVKKYGEKMVYEEGLNVYTTLDITKQLAAQETLRRGLLKQSTVSKGLAFKNYHYVAENYSGLVELFALMFDIDPFAKKGSVESGRFNAYLESGLLDELEALNLIVGLDVIDIALDGYKRQFTEEVEFQQVEGALISINPTNGYIEALVGGREFSQTNQLNRAMQSRRQPGSSIKPLIYAAAMESGKFSPGSAVLDSPIIYLDSQHGDWIPENYEGEYYGLIRLRRALAMSINVVTIRVAETLGLEYVIRYLDKLLKFDEAESKQRIPRNMSIALGSFEVSPFELARAYAIIANGGKDVIPFSIRSVRDRRGTVLENQEEEVRAQLLKEEKNGSLQIIKPETAQVMISMLRSVISEGTGRGASPGRVAGGKTGSTNNWKDAWFVGFVPQLATCIWVGYDKLGLSLGVGQAGGGVAAPMWGQYMREALKNEPVLQFPNYAPLAGGRVCASSGLLPSPSCKEVIDEIFVPGSQPDKACDVCSGEAGVKVGSFRRGPKENITSDQKKSIMSNIKKRSGEGKPVLRDFGDDLLD
ncbi:MAG TPA: PBP1A family penicillin-binding protein [Spirochaetota bacterium]|nr:PBP1A family penicillin-binding protein [Spirochaetota bacterium]